MGSRWLGRTSSDAPLKTAASERQIKPDSMPPYVGALNPEQTKAFEIFKKLAGDKKLIRSAGEVDGKWRPASHDDSTLLRFLRARQYDPNAALGQFEATEKWRKDAQLNTAYDNMDVADFETARTVYPQWTGRRDKRGIPLYVYLVSHLKPKELAEYNKPLKAIKGTPEPKSMKLYAIYESLTQFVLPVCGAVHPDGAVPCTSNIVDISKVGLWTFWNLKGHMQEASELATAHYPETLDRIFIIGAPSFFSTVWGWIKKWFDPVTVSKMFILAPHEVLPTLLKFVDIENIPKAYGGKLDWEFAQPPLLDDELKGVLGKIGEDGGWQKGPIRYVVGQQQDEITAVGTVDGQQRGDILSTLEHSSKGGESSVEKAGVEENGHTISPEPLAAVAASSTTDTAPEPTEPVPTASMPADKSASTTASAPTQESAALSADYNVVSPGSPEQSTRGKVLALASHVKADLTKNLSKVGFLHNDTAAQSAPKLSKTQALDNSSPTPELAAAPTTEEAEARPAIAREPTLVPAVTLAPIETEKLQEQTLPLTTITNMGSPYQHLSAAAAGVVDDSMAEPTEKPGLYEKGEGKAESQGLQQTT